jgi:MFS family permease
MEYLSTIRHGRFAFLWSAQILSQVAANLLNFALIINVYNTSGGRNFANILVSLLVLAYGLPSILFAALAGTLIDRWDKRYVLLASNIARGALVLLYIVFHHNLWLILGLTFLISSISQFFVPAESALIPRLVAKKDLLTANSLFVFSLYASFIVGYAVAAPVIAILGEEGPYLLTSAMFALAALAILGLPSRGLAVEPTRSAQADQMNFKDELLLGMRLIRSDRWIGFSIRQLTITQGIVSIILTLAPALSLALLHLPLQRSSQYLIIPAGLGMIIGVVSVQHLNRRWNRIRILEIGLVVAGGALLLLGLTGLLYRSIDGHQIVRGAQIGLIVAVLIFALGMMNAIISSTAQTLLQEQASEDSRGKIFGALNMFINIAATVPILFTGLLADLLSVTEVIMLIGSVVIVYAFVQLRHMSRQHVGASVTRN